MQSTTPLLHHSPTGRLRVTLPDRSHLFARAVWAAPLSRPNTYLALIDEKGDEIALLPTLDHLDTASRAALDTELRRRYVQAVIHRLIAIDAQHGAFYFTAQTDRGTREFVMQHLHDNAIWFSPTHVLLIDVDSNRYEIPNTTTLDPQSQRLIREVF